MVPTSTSRAAWATDTPSRSTVERPIAAASSSRSTRWSCSRFTSSTYRIPRCAAASSPGSYADPARAERLLQVERADHPVLGGADRAARPAGPAGGRRRRRCADRPGRRGPGRPGRRRSGSPGRPADRAARRPAPAPSSTSPSPSRPAPAPRRPRARSRSAPGRGPCRRSRRRQRTGRYARSVEASSRVSTPAVVGSPPASAAGDRDVLTDRSVGGRRASQWRDRSRSALDSSPVAVADPPTRRLFVGRPETAGVA